MENIIEIIVAILTGLAACIPLVYKLYKAIKESVQEKNWPHLLDLVMSLMETAENKFNDGVTRKDWVIAMVKASAEFVNYPVNDQFLADMIEALCRLTKKVNAPEVVTGGKADGVAGPGPSGVIRDE